jgi:hypothetical protein
MPIISSMVLIGYEDIKMPSGDLLKKVVIKSREV